MSNLKQLILGLSPTHVLTVLAAVVALGLTQGLVTDSTAKLVTGLAAFVIPAVLAVVHALLEHARATVTAANIRRSPLVK